MLAKPLPCLAYSEVQLLGLQLRESEGSIQNVGPRAFAGISGLSFEILKQSPRNLLSDLAMMTLGLSSGSRRTCDEVFQVVVQL